jgi:hypothetical protein
MRTFLKVIFLLIILASIALVMFYSRNKEALHEELRLRLAAELSSRLKCHVSIGNVRYIPFQSIDLENVSLTPMETEHAKAIDINRVTITPDITSFLRDKQLNILIDAKGISSDNILCNALLRTVSAKADSYKEALDPALLNSIFIIDGLLSAKKVTFRNVAGTIEMNGLDLVSGKVYFGIEKTGYLVDFVPLKNKANGYDISLRSDKLGFHSVLTMTKEDLQIEELTGMFYTLRFSFKGDIKDYLSDAPVPSLSGSIDTDLSSFAFFPGVFGKFFREQSITGPLSSELSLKASSSDILDWKASAAVDGNDLRLGKVKIYSFPANCTLGDGKLNIVARDGIIYGGDFSLDIIMDITHKDVPYMLTFKINDMDYGFFMQDISDDKTYVFGDLNADVSLKGYIGEWRTAEGNGSITLSNANLGPMPILAPFLGEHIYPVFRKFIPENEQVNINEAYMDFNIKDQKIMTDDLTLLGNDIYIAAEGYMDFDGNLDFEFSNHFRESYEEDDENWQLAVRDALVNFGQFVGKTRLKGTIKKPEWGM